MHRNSATYGLYAKTIHTLNVVNKGRTHEACVHCEVWYHMLIAAVEARDLEDLKGVLVLLFVL